MRAHARLDPLDPPQTSLSGPNVRKTTLGPERGPSRVIRWTGDPDPVGSCLVRVVLPYAVAGVVGERERGHPPRRTDPAVVGRQVDSRSRTVGRQSRRIDVGRRMIRD